MNTINILITGGRNWDNEAAMRRKLIEVTEGYDTFTLYHGGAGGADKMAAQIAEEMGARVLLFPAEWEIFGKSAGFKRNELMRDRFVADGAGPVLAFKAEYGSNPGSPWCDEGYGGTEHMVSICKQVGLHGWVVRG